MSLFLEIFLAALLAIAVWDWWTPMRKRREVQKKIKRWKKSNNVDDMLASLAYRSYRPQLFRGFAHWCINGRLPEGCRVWPLKNSAGESLLDIERNCFFDRVRDLLNSDIKNELWDFKEWKEYTAEVETRRQGLLNAAQQKKQPGWLQTLESDDRWVNSQALARLREACQFALEAVTLLAGEDFASESAGHFRSNAESWAAAQWARDVASHCRCAADAFATAILLAETAKLIPEVQKKPQDLKDPVAIHMATFDNQADYLRGYCPWGDTPMEISFPDGKYPEW